MPEFTTKPCPNCGLPQDGRYCHHCGQDNHLGRLDARQIAGELLQNVTGWESALGATLKGLARGPGKLVADYVAGRRRHYVNPVRFCLLSLALWLLVARLVSVDPLDASGIRITNSSGSHSDVVVDVRAFMTKNLEILMFLAIPLRALLMRAFFRGSGRNVAECLVLVLYVSGAGYLLGALLVPLVALDQEWAGRVRPLLTIGLSYWAALSFFGSSWFGTLWRVVLVSLLHVIGTIVLFACLAIPWVLLARG